VLQVGDTSGQHVNGEANSSDKYMMTEMANSEKGMPSVPAIHNNSTPMNSSAPSRDVALCCFTPENALRRWCNRLRLEPRFDQFIMSVIIINSICMAIERPSIDDDSDERAALDALGHIFTAIFSVEFFVKVIGMGLFYGPEPYWAIGWNKLDGVIVWISWLDLVLTIVGVTGGLLGILKICRMFRALRPLRAISRLPGLKRVVNVLILSLAPIGTTLIIVFVFFFLFGVLGGMLFSGKFYYCDTEDETLLEQIITKEDCLTLVGPNAWINQPYNFDHLGNSLMTLFVLSSIDGWVEIMYSGVDVVGVDKQPKENNSEGFVIFFVGFLLIGGFFIINMFVGVIVENFQKHGSSEVQKEVKDAEAETEVIPEIFEDTENYSQLRRKVLAHATSTRFETFIGAIIVANVFVMATYHYDVSYRDHDPAMSPSYHSFMKITNYIFTAIFIYEMAVKQWAFGIKRYFCGAPPRSLAGWNNFDAFIVAISILGIVFDDLVSADDLPVDPAILRILRILRVARILKLLKGAKDLLILLNVVAGSLAQVGNLGLLLFLLFFIYAALGIELFGRLECTENNPCDGISDYANFNNFGMAMLVLFRLSTGDNWNGMMKDGLREVPPVSTNASLVSQYSNDYGCDFSVSCEENCCSGCDDSESCKENCCANRTIVPFYFISFCVLSTFVMLNLVVATLMGELEKAGGKPPDDGISMAKDDSVDMDKVSVPLGVPKLENVQVDTNTVARITPVTPVEESPSETSPDGTSAEGEASSPTAGSRVKLEPLPMRPASPSVFVPFAPETIAHNDPAEGEDTTESHVLSHTEVGTVGGHNR